MGLCGKEPDLLDPLELGMRLEAAHGVLAGTHNTAGSKEPQQRER